MNSSSRDRTSWEGGQRNSPAGSRGHFCTPFARSGARAGTGVERGAVVSASEHEGAAGRHTCHHGGRIEGLDESWLLSASSLRILPKNLIRSSRLACFLPTSPPLTTPPPWRPRGASWTAERSGGPQGASGAFASPPARRLPPQRPEATVIRAGSGPNAQSFPPPRRELRSSPMAWTSRQRIFELQRPRSIPPRQTTMTCQRTWCALRAPCRTSLRKGQRSDASGAGC